MYVMASREDHIVPWEGAYRSTAALKGKVAIANAKVAYQQFKEAFGGERSRALVPAMKIEDFRMTSISPAV